MNDDFQILAYVDSFASHQEVRSICIKESISSIKPLVSIMIPTYRRPELLREAVVSALAQTTSIPFEVVVVDNDPDSVMTLKVDNLINSISASNLRLFRNESNIGMFANWNRCISLARGTWVTILNDDDLLECNYLAYCLELLGTRPNIKMVACGAFIRDERKVCGDTLSKSRRYGSVVKRIIQMLRPTRLVKLTACDYFLENPHCGSLGVLLHKESAIHTGGFNPAAYPSADFVFFVRLQSMYSILLTNKKLATYRINQNESLRWDVVEKFMSQSIQIRRELQSKVPIPQSVCNLYSRWLSIEIGSHYAESWGVSVDKLNVHDMNFSPPTSVYWRVRGLKFLIRLWCSLISYLPKPYAS